VKLRLIIIILCMAYEGIAYAEVQPDYYDPQYVTPLLSQPAIVMPIGHGQLRMHLYQTSNYGSYNDAYTFESLPLATTKEARTSLIYGITEDTEVQAVVTYLHNKMEGRQAGNLGDTRITVATQLMLQNERTWPPNIKLALSQLFPTGRYDQLDLGLLATDATGQGSYLTTLAMNMEHVTGLGGQHYMVEFATVGFTHASLVSLQGHSIYGGGPETRGSIFPGNSLFFNLALEYLPNQRWGFIMETYIYAQQASDFKGDRGRVLPRFIRAEDLDVLPANIRNQISQHRINNSSGIVFNGLRPSFLNLGGDQGIGHGNVSQFTLAPAINYNFTKDISLTAGVWLTVAGKNSPAFYSPMLEFTAEW